MQTDFVPLLREPQRIGCRFVDASDPERTCPGLRSIRREPDDIADAQSAVFGQLPRDQYRWQRRVL